MVVAKIWDKGIGYKVEYDDETGNFLRDISAKKISLEDWNNQQYERTIVMEENENGEG